MSLPSEFNRGLFGFLGAFLIGGLSLLMQLQDGAMEKRKFHLALWVFALGCMLGTVSGIIFADTALQYTRGLGLVDPNASGFLAGAASLWVAERLVRRLRRYGKEQDSKEETK